MLFHGLGIFLVFLAQITNGVLGEYGCQPNSSCDSDVEQCSYEKCRCTSRFLLRCTGYFCTACDLKAGTCTHTSKCECIAGYTPGRASSCIDVNESNRNGICHDVNECDEEACHNAAVCSNYPGGYTCTCGQGYTGDGASCTDVNECDKEMCHNAAVCSNYPGGYNCTCGQGYVGDGINCTEVNECDEEVCHNAAVCSNYQGGYNCTCGQGYTGDGRNCTEMPQRMTGSISTETVAGIVVGVLLVLVAAVAIVVFILIKRRRSKNEQSEHENTDTPAAHTYTNVAMSDLRENRSSLPPDVIPNIGTTDDSIDDLYSNNLINERKQIQSRETPKSNTPSNTNVTDDVSYYNISPALSSKNGIDSNYDHLTKPAMGDTTNTVRRLTITSDSVDLEVPGVQENVHVSEGVVEVYDQLKHAQQILNEQSPNANNDGVYNHLYGDTLYAPADPQIVDECLEIDDGYTLAKNI